jgi:hypothetical protein
MNTLIVDLLVNVNQHFFQFDHKNEFKRQQEEYNPVQGPPYHFK